MILMKLSQKLQMEVFSSLTPSPGPSVMSMSSKTPGIDLDDKWSLGMVPDFLANFKDIWYHHLYLFSGTILMVGWKILQGLILVDGIMDVPIMLIPMESRSELKELIFMKVNF